MTSVAGRKYRKLPPDEVCQLYLSGLGTVEIAERFDSTPPSVNACLRRNGLTIRSAAEALALIKASGRQKKAIDKKCSFNEFEVRGDVVAVFAQSKKGEEFEILIDYADLPLLQERGRRWYVVRRHHTCYAKGQVNGEMVYLHQFLMGGSSRSNPVDHKNHNGLDNRRENLRVIPQSINMLNRKGPRKGSFTGVRGVSAGRHGLWNARVGGRHLGTFVTKEEASAAVAKKLTELGVIA